MYYSTKELQNYTRGSFEETCALVEQTAKEYTIIATLAECIIGQIEIDGKLLFVRVPYVCVDSEVTLGEHEVLDIPLLDEDEKFECAVNDYRSAVDKIIKGDMQSIAQIVALTPHLENKDAWLSDKVRNFVELDLTWIDLVEELQEDTSGLLVQLPTRRYGGLKNTSRYKKEMKESAKSAINCLESLSVLIENDKTFQSMQKDVNLLTNGLQSIVEVARPNEFDTVAKYIDRGLDLSKEMILVYSTLTTPHTEK